VVRVKFVNLLLNALDEASLARVEGKLELVSLPIRNVLVEAGGTTEWLYFIEDGLISLVSEYEAGRMIEVGMIGREGLFDPGYVLRDNVAAFFGTVQAEGTAYCLSKTDFREMMDTDPAFHTLMLMFARAFELQVASTASANGRALLEERLARWLLMVHDRLDSQIFHITHEFLSQMLCTRRPGVTVALHLLEGKGLIASSRGQIEIRNRDGLMEEAGDAYGKAEAHYARLLGWDFRRRTG
jgi:CRP-like cAMP-binding protein